MLTRLKKVENLQSDLDPKYKLITPIEPIDKTKIINAAQKYK